MPRQPGKRAARRASADWLRRQFPVRLPLLNAPSGASTRQRPLPRRIVAMLLPALLISLSLAAAGPRASAAPGCSASYATQSQWSGGMVSGVTVTNTGTSALTAWTVTFTFGGDQKVTNAWGASVTQSIEYVTAANASYDGSVAVGAST